MSVTISHSLIPDEERRRGGRSARAHRFAGVIHQRRAPASEEHPREFPRRLQLIGRDKPQTREPTSPAPCQSVCEFVRIESFRSPCSAFAPDQKPDVLTGPIFVSYCVTMKTHTATGGKYRPLTDFLRRQTSDVKAMSFDDVERVIGQRLPESARRHRAWWSNNPQNSVMTQAWLDAGFESEQVDMAQRRLVFRRTRRLAAAGQARGADAGGHPLVGWMKDAVTIAPSADLTAPADPDWAGLASDVVQGARNE